jgi:diguanylate cyclase (GGDEF)-like protein
MTPISAGALRVFKTSLTAKVFGICFLSVHVPLLVFIVCLATGFEAAPGPVFGLLLVATLVGTVACLSILWWVLRPLRTLTHAVKAYRQDGTPIRMNLRQPDEIGVLTSAVTAMVSEVDGLVQRLRHQAMSDPLTGLGNRRWLSERMAQEMARAKRQTEPLSMILFDLDHFKKINDTFGHDVGDKVLVAAGEVVRSCMRPYDLGARIGGEEFCLILPRTTLSEASSAAERLRGIIERTVVEPLPKGAVTASFGVYQSTAGDGLQQMLKHCDEALYEAKHAGRNRVRQAIAPIETVPHHGVQQLSA